MHGLEDRPAISADPAAHARGEVDRDRRRLIASLAGLGAAATLGSGLVPSRALAATATAPASGSAAAFGPLRTIRAGDLDVAYVDAGPASGTPVLLLHGWPYDIHSYAEATALLAASGYRVIVPHLRGYGQTRFLSAEAPRNAQQSVFALDAIALLDALHIKSAIMGGFDWGARTVNILAALWPERCKAMVSVSGYLIGSQAANRAPLPPAAEQQWWYQFYFATDRGRDGYARNTKDFARLIWQTASPRWHFDDATFLRSVQSLENPDHVAITINNYRWRLGLERGDPKLDTYETALAKTPAITVPTITMEGDVNGAPHPPPASYAGRFTGPYQHRNSSGGIGHNLPQEAPQDFAKAVIDVASL